MMDGSVPFISLFNASSDVSICTDQIVKDSCVIDEASIGGRDVIALVRLLASALSFLGAASIIISSIYKRQVLSPRVHPIFVFSIADIMLSVLWIAGSALWLLRTKNMHRGWCFAASLITVILVCVVINLTLVYAIISYSAVKKQMATSEQGLYEDGPHVTGVGEYPCSVWHPLKSTLVYFVAWFSPIVLVMLPFTIITNTGHFRILDHVYKCTCWCRPSFGNAVPYVGGAHLATSMYIYELGKILTMYGAVLSAHYFVVFFSLIYVYYKLLKAIAKMKKLQVEAHQASRSKLYETIKLKLEIYQSHTKRRVALYIFVFIFTGFFNFVLSLLVIILEAQQLSVPNPLGPIKKDPLWLLIVYYLQSSTLPLQGFFNAIVYGWTKQNFVDVVVGEDTTDENAALIHTFPLDVDQSINNEEKENHSHRNGVDGTLASRKSLHNGQSLTISSSLENRAGDITELSETEGESSYEQYATHKV